MSRIYAEKVFHFKAEGHEFTFSCFTEDNRSGFKHHARLIDCETWDTIGSTVAQYYNRTWECYGYQSVCNHIACALASEERETLKREWMEERGYKRMTQKRKSEWEKARVTSDRLRLFLTLSFVIGGSYHNERPWTYDGNDGERERAILRDLGDVQNVMDTEEHNVYRLFNSDGSAFCDYDAITRRYVG